MRFLMEAISRIEVRPEIVKTKALSLPQVSYCSSLIRL
jgi:hypothetical protein